MYSEWGPCTNVIDSVMAPFSAYIRQNTGQTFTEFLANKRIEIAKKLLRYTSLSVQGVAERVGYTEYSYFS